MILPESTAIRISRWTGFERRTVRKSRWGPGIAGGWLETGNKKGRPEGRPF
jgi:hypothetical protein